MRDDQKFLDTFSALRESNLNHDVISTLKVFTCVMYRHPHCKNVNDAFKVEFNKKCKQKVK